MLNADDLVEKDGVWTTDKDIPKRQIKIDPDEIMSMKEFREYISCKTISQKVKWIEVE